MKYVTRLFNGRINRRTYLLGVTLNWAGVFLIDLPLIIFLLERFTRPTHIHLTPAYVIMPIVLPLIICIQVLYYFSFDVRRSHDVESGKDRDRQNLFFWDYFIKEGEKKQNKYGSPPKPTVAIRALFLGQ